MTMSNVTNSICIFILAVICLGICIRNSSEEKFVLDELQRCTRRIYENNERINHLKIETYRFSLNTEHPGKYKALIDGIEYKAVKNTVKQLDAFNHQIGETVNYKLMQSTKNSSEEYSEYFDLFMALQNEYGDSELLGSVIKPVNGKELI